MWGEGAGGLPPALSSGSPRVQPQLGPSSLRTGSEPAWLELSGCPPLPGPPSSAPLFRCLAASRPRDRPPSGDPVLALLTVEQVPLEKAGEAAVIQQDGQEHACGRARVTRRPGAPQARDRRMPRPTPSADRGLQTGPGLALARLLPHPLPWGRPPRRSVGTGSRVHSQTTLWAPCSAHKCAFLPGPSPDAGVSSTGW